MNKTIFQKIENTFTASAFAEAGEHSTAIHIAGIKPALRSRIGDIVQIVGKYFAATGFAEAGCFDMAHDFAFPKPPGVRSGESLETFLETVGLRNARVSFGLATIHETLGSFLKTVGLNNTRACYSIAEI